MHEENPRTSGQLKKSMKTKPEEEAGDAEERPLSDIAEKPGSTSVPEDHADALADEWGEESFPASDPPAHY